jgi:hypothetical protein
MTLTEKDKHGYILLAAALGIIVSPFIAQIYLSGKPKPGPDGCGTPVVADTVIMLDRREPLAIQTRHEITSRILAHVQDKVQVNERVTVFYVGDDSNRALEPAFSRCKLPQKANRIYEDTQGVERAYRRDFIEPLEKSLGAAQGNSKDASIAQALIDVSLSRYLRATNNTLLVYSDMLENTRKFSLHRCVDPQGSIAAFRTSRSGSQERPRFLNARIVLNIIPRADIPRPTLKCRDLVWTWFFGDNSGRDGLLELDYLPGA